MISNADYEISKLAKDLGFNEPCNTQFYKKSFLNKLNINKNSDNDEDEVSRPNLEELRTWLRKSKRIHIKINKHTSGVGLQWYFEVSMLGNESNLPDKIGSYTNQHDTSLLDAISMCLEMLKKQIV
jgi:hypothetical protein